MLSVLVYGRNDSHGYNLHKRAAISLNTIAHQLDDPDDEILFVDYNTPDNLPTFVEAIQDTLTDRAKERMRVIRVRGTVHDRLRGRTHLAAVESFARNVAARRSNPANRWLLSTNTDMIFVPHEDGRSLSAITGGLEDGFYCLPRFELPETFWEALNRLDPAGTLARVREWGTRFHLNDIVYGGDDILYDAPGDFQLMLREDFFGIGGFDEAMILGWHVDSNISRRLRLLRGRVRGAVDHLFGYHCDHTRQATLMHGHDRVEDDWRRFVEEVQRPDLPEQMETWGLAGERLEEFSPAETSQSQVCLRTLSGLLEPMPVRAIESDHTDTGFHDLSYSPEHVLPYLVDLLASMPRHWSLMYAGCRPRLFALVEAAWTALGFTGTLIRPEGFAHLGGAGPVLPVEEAFARATLVLAEFGYGSADDPQAEPSRTGAWSAADRSRLARTKMVFEDCLAAEAERAVPPGEPPRYFIAVNAIYNVFEDSVNANLSITYTPYSSRVRHGYVLRAKLPAVLHERRAMGRWLQARLNRRSPVPFGELSHLLRLAVSLLRTGTVPGDHPPGARALLAVPLLALLDLPDLADLAGVTPERVAALRAEIAAARPSQELRAVVALPTADHAPDHASDDQPLSRIAAVESWEDPAWRAWAHRHFGGSNAYNYFDRGLWAWERVQLLYGLHRFGLLRPDKAILVVTHAPDALYAVLTQHAGRVDVAHPGPAPADEAGEAFWRAPIELVAPERLRVVHDALDRLTPPEGGYDAVVCIGNTLFENGPAATYPLLGWAEAQLRADGVLAFSARVLLNGGHAGPWLAGPSVAAGEPEATLAAHTGLEPLGPFAATLSEATLDRLQDLRTGSVHHGHFVLRDGAEVSTAGVWFLRKRRPTDPAAWRTLHEAATAGLYGEILDGMRSPPEVSRTADGMRVDAAAAGGDVLFGPYLKLPAGRFRLTLRARVDAAQPPARALLTVAVRADGAAEPVAWWDVAAADLTDGAFQLVFEVPKALSALGGTGARFEFPVTHFGGTALAIDGVRLDPVPDGTPVDAPVRLLPLARMVVSQQATALEPGAAVGAEAEASDLLYGPNLRLPAGAYRLSVSAAADGADDPGRTALSVRVLAGSEAPRLWHDVPVRALADGPLAVDFTVPPELAESAPDGGAPFEFRIAHLGGLAVRVTGLRLERLAAPPAPAPAVDLDALARMPAADGVRRDGEGVAGDGGTPGVLLFGPYLKLPAGAYRLAIDAAADAASGGVSADRPALSLELVAGNAPQLLLDSVAGDLAGGPLTVDFLVPPETAAGAGDLPYEFRIGQLGAPLRIRGVRLTALPGAGDARLPPLPVRMELLPRLGVAEIGQRAGGAVTVAADAAAANVLFGPYVALPAGAYRLEVTARVTGVPADRPALAVEVTAGGVPRLMLDAAAGTLAHGPFGVDFVVAPEDAAGSGDGKLFEFRLGHLEGALEIRGVRLSAVPGAAARPPEVPVRLALLPRLSTTGIGRRVDGAVTVSGKDQAGDLLFGPYIRLPAGPYALEVAGVAAPGLFRRGKPVCTVTVTAGGTAMAGPLPLTQADLADGRVRVPFTVTPDRAGPDAPPIEFVFAHTGAGDLTIRAVGLASAG